MKDQILKVSFFAVMIIYLWFPAQMIYNNEDLLEDGLAYRFKPVPVDPYDAFRGRFIRLGYNLNNIPYPEANTTFVRGQKVYMKVAQGADGFAELSDVLLKAPDQENYIECKVRSVYENQISVEPPENLSRYYLNEKMAPLAERHYMDLVRDQSSNPEKLLVHIDVRLKNGKCIIEELYFEDEPIKTYLQRIAASPDYKSPN